MAGVRYSAAISTGIAIVAQTAPDGSASARIRQCRDPKHVRRVIGREERLDEGGHDRRDNDENAGGSRIIPERTRLPFRCGRCEETCQPAARGLRDSRP